MATDPTVERRGGDDGPPPGRPRLPAGYGVPASGEGLLAWSHAAERLARARNYWIGTTLPDGTPHAVPVWGVWVDGRLFFGMDRRTRTARNLERSPAIVVHLESGDDVVILKGRVEVVTDRALLRRAGEIGAAKYGGGTGSGDAASDAEADNEGNGGAGHRVYAVSPRAAYAWDNFPENVTRWHFPPD